MSRLNIEELEGELAALAAHIYAIDLAHQLQPATRPRVPGGRGDPSELVDRDRAPHTVNVEWPDRMDLTMVVDGMLRAGRGRPP